MALKTSAYNGNELNTFLQLNLVVSHPLDGEVDIIPFLNAEIPEQFLTKINKPLDREALKDLTDMLATDLSLFIAE